MCELSFLFNVCGNFLAAKVNYLARVLVSGCVADNLLQNSQLRIISFMDGQEN